MIPVFIKFSNTRRINGLFAKYADEQWHEIAKVNSEDEYHKFIKNWRKLHIFASTAKFAYGSPPA